MIGVFWATDSEISIYHLLLNLIFKEEWSKLMRCLENNLFSKSTKIILNTMYLQYLLNVINILTHYLPDSFKPSKQCRYSFNINFKSSECQTILWTARLGICFLQSAVMGCPVDAIFHEPNASQTVTCKWDEAHYKYQIPQMQISPKQ